MKKNILLGCLGLLGVVAAGAGAVVISSQKAARADAAPVTLTEITSLSSIATNTSYLITGTSSSVEYYPILNGGTAAIAAGNISAGLKSAVTSTTNLLKFSVQGDGTYYLSDGSYYLGTNNTNNGLKTSTTAFKWTIAYVSGSGFTFKESTNSRYVSLYSGSNWRCYTSANYVKIYSVAEAASVAPTSISFGSYSTTMMAGTTQDITATMLPTNETESVVWTTSNSNVLSLSDTGTTGGVSTATVTPIGNGTATITATAETTTSVTITTSTITVTGFSTDLAPRTVSATSLGLSTSYASSAGIKIVNGAAFQVTDCMTISSDYIKSSSVVNYQKDGIQMKTGTGAISNPSKFAASVTKVRVCAVGTTSTLTVKGGATAGATTSTAAVANDGRFFVYTFDTAVDYVVVGGSTSTVYINCITFEFTGGAISAASLADYIIGIQPERADDTALCLGSTGNYVNAKNRYIDAPVAVRQEFQDSTDATVVTARTRYVQWAAMYGDTTPFSLTYGTAAYNFVGNPENSDTTLVAVLVSFVVVGGFAAFMMIRRKKQA
jgi:hypothetical protein